MTTHVRGRGNGWTAVAWLGALSAWSGCGAKTRDALDAADERAEDVGETPEVTDDRPLDVTEDETSTEVALACVLEGEVRCEGECVSLDTDPRHCGACGARCGPEEQCRAGRCDRRPGCARPLTDCDGACVDLATSSAHCGACERRCGHGQVCRAGTCR